MILVAGGTGTLGRLLVDHLTDRDLPVRVLTRNVELASGFFPRNVQIVHGDVRDAPSLVPAMDGVDVVVSAIQGFVGAGGVSPESVDKQGNFNLIDAAAKVGAGFILVSVVGAAPDSPMELFRAKYAAEQYLQAGGLAWTIVRATSFIETWAMVIGEPLRKTGKTMVFGQGANPINFVSTIDVAGLIELAVIQPSLRGRIIELGGGENFSFNQFTDELQRIIGPGKVRHIPRAMLHVMAMMTSKLKPALSRQATAAIAMDTRDMVFDASSTRHEFTQVPETILSTALRRYFESVSD